MNGDVMRDIFDMLYAFSSWHKFLSRVYLYSFMTLSVVVIFNIFLMVMEEAYFSIEQRVRDEEREKAEKKQKEIADALNRSVLTPEDDDTSLFALVPPSLDETNSELSTIDLYYDSLFEILQIKIAKIQEETNSDYHGITIEQNACLRKMVDSTKKLENTLKKLDKQVQLVNDSNRSRRSISFAAKEAPALVETIHRRASLSKDQPPSILKTSSRWKSEFIAASSPTLSPLTKTSKVGFANIEEPLTTNEPDPNQPSTTTEPSQENSTTQETSPEPLVSFSTLSVNTESENTLSVETEKEDSPATPSPPDSPIEFDEQTKSGT
eukprot:CAMPEP_0117432150 /NCGR_PEP_ID=MMETSP0758-20121206/11689_1 /TAXON_ID=63605 /ORGANISM="Percolomonas cosmopolitus, Strain AE-1 (ATCC 50343)" /LENGTH=322 /DNA_ID=CAMNT_0005221881 /DNA_START=1164 /DNA_END=2129 /DNA_ORIENTATION=+